MGKKISIIGSGFAGISASAYLAKAGHDVHVFEKNAQLGGRARQFSSEGFTFDMGPSWYWMPDVFEKFFNDFGHTVSGFYDLKRLSPSYRVFYPAKEIIDIPASLDELYALFERIEPGSTPHLKRFLNEAAFKYEIGITEMVQKPGRSITEFIDLELAKNALKLDVFKPFSKYIRKYFKDPRLLQLLEFPILFLGAMPKDIPALYSLMNYADMALGTWYPMGGMHNIVEAMVKTAEDQGVTFHTNATVSEIRASKKSASAIVVDGKEISSDVIVGAADYQHTERLLTKEFRNYDSKYWDKRVMAPSCLLYYVGVNKRLKNLLHHNLFFDEDFAPHAKEIYETPQWPTKPLFYASCPSLTDSSVAPEGHENLFLLIPVAPGIKETPEIQNKYFDMIVNRLEKRTGQSIKDSIVYKRSYAYSDFVKDYNSFKGNAYGLANTLMQTAILKPKLKSKKLNNLYFAGQLTVPGPGVPPAIISGEVVAREIEKDLK